MLGGKTAQMLRVRLDAETPCVPESRQQVVLNIRFLAQKRRRSRPRIADWTSASSSFCNL